MAGPCSAVETKPGKRLLANTARQRAQLLPAVIVESYKLGIMRCGRPSEPFRSLMILRIELPELLGKRSRQFFRPGRAEREQARVRPVMDTGSSFCLQNQPVYLQPDYSRASRSPPDFAPGTGNRAKTMAISAQQAVTSIPACSGSASFPCFSPVIPNGNDATGLSTTRLSCGTRCKQAACGSPLVSYHQHLHACV